MRIQSKDTSLLPYNNKSELTGTNKFNLCNSANNDGLNSFYIGQYQIKWQLFSHLCPHEHIGLSEYPFSNKCEFKSQKPIPRWAMNDLLY